MSNLSTFSSEVHVRCAVKVRHLAAFLLLAVVTFAGLEAAVRAMLVKKSSSFQTVHALKSSAGEIEILLLGDSHFEKMIGKDSAYPNPDERIFDLSTSGSNYILSYYLFKHFLKELPSLRAIVLPLDLHSFNSFRRNRIISPYFWDRYVDHEEVVSLGGGAAHKKKIFQFNILKEETGRTRLLTKLTRGWVRLSENPETEKFTPESARARVDYQLSGESNVDPLLLLYFEKILKLAKNNNLKVITTQTPISKVYAERAFEHLDFEELFDKTLRRFQDEDLIDDNLDFADIFFEKPEYFEYDGDHLNKEGSKVFSQIFAAKLLDLLESKTPAVSVTSSAE